MLLPVLAPRRPSLLVRYIAPACFLLLLCYSFSIPSRLQLAAAATAAQLHEKHRQHYHQGQQVPVIIHGDDKKNGKPSSPQTPTPASPSSTQHPVEHLVAEAERQFRDLLAQETHSLGDAAAAYRKRRGRHPPPGFDRWHKFASERNVVVVESFWDQIYHDLHPFWALPPKLIQREARAFDMTIKIRKGRATTKSSWFWTQIWLDLLRTIESELPDMDLALNAMDEPRVVVAWEAMKNYVVEAERTQVFPPPEQVQQAFQSLPFGDDDNSKDREAVRDDNRWTTTGPFWELVQRGCAPHSMARQTSTSSAARTSKDGRPIIDDTYTSPHMYHGFVSNSSLSSDICHQPDLQGLNGIFIEPLSISTTGTLLPIFGGSKLSVNSDILLPAPMYWSNEERFAGGGGEASDVPWSQKRNGAVWRGVATGGHNRASNWKGFHRHRFVAMNDGQLVSKAEANPDDVPNFTLPSPSYHILAQDEDHLGEWVSQWSDVGFVDLMCDGAEKKVNDTTEGSCPYVDDYFFIHNSISLQEQFHSKFLPDIDGNSFSGRYLAFLKSTSLPIKATVWKEWHDARLVAWKHFVPMDNRFSDWFGIVDYFMADRQGGQDKNGDRVADKIANDGRAWADRVLRREDMQVYVFRLLLEYARVLDEKRELLGWVGDLKS
ncbi:hypothetical protein Sste5346_009918 [Sporothrix stenoceras]|uniref:Glycosyl transferase CAP10 domain-containing protein n=1 Tax=Sporothrix stenoceras TaxID=5173 RepID=A0ABR3YKF8_9PEZI